MLGKDNFSFLGTLMLIVVLSTPFFYDLLKRITTTSAVGEHGWLLVMVSLACDYTTILLVTL